MKASGSQRVIGAMDVNINIDKSIIVDEYIITDGAAH
jgi:hypothetical protein